MILRSASFFTLSFFLWLLFLGNANSNPWQTSDIAGAYQAQSQLMHRRVGNSIDPIILRLNKIWNNRRISAKDGLYVAKTLSTSHLIETADTKPVSDIKRYENQFKSSISVHLANSLEDSEKHDNWSYWSVASVEIGEIGKNIYEPSIVYQTDGLTIGMEKYFRQNALWGFTLESGEDKSEAGFNGSRLTTNDIGLSTYFRLGLAGNYYLNTTYGINKLSSYSQRKSSGNFLKSERQSYQIYQSASLIKDLQYGDFSINPYSRIDIGFTNLRPYQESGTSLGVSFSEQKLILIKSYFGILVTHDLLTPHGKFRPYARIEYILDSSTASNPMAFYGNSPNTLYHSSLHNLRESSWRYTLGLDLNFYSGWFTFQYDRKEDAEPDERNEPERESDKLSVKLLYKF